MRGGRVKVANDILTVLTPPVTAAGVGGAEDRARGAALKQVRPVYAPQVFVGVGGEGAPGTLETGRAIGGAGEWVVDHVSDKPWKSENKVTVVI